MRVLNKDERFFKLICNHVCDDKLRKKNIREIVAYKKYIKIYTDLGITTIIDKPYLIRFKIKDIISSIYKNKT